MTEPFNNNASQKERREFVKDTYHNRYQDETGGRFAKNVPTNVSGKDPSTLYPRIPTGPWSANYAQVPPEAPYPEDISTPPIVGEHHEVEASLDREFGLQRSLRDGAPDHPSSGRSSHPRGDGDVGAPPANAAAPSSPSGSPRPVDRDLGEVPHLVEGQHSAERERQTRMLPQNIRRRLV